jgi:predicted nucleotidyltransferase
MGVVLTAADLNAFPALRRLPKGLFPPTAGILFPMGTNLLDTETLVGNLAKLLAARAEKEGIAAAWLFGSVARGTARPDSDVDVGVLYQEDPPRTLAGIGQVFNLEEDLTEATDLPIQVVNLNNAPVDLIIRVLRDGKLLVGHDSLQRVDFEVRSRNEFWDLEPYLRLYRGQIGRPAGE